ncbi:SGNH/GDSL hydrolase family protein [Lactococcus petauri]|uniref:SGNH/GDSL hydrolase family protein n=1 Tax=Lactococcus petauri TaxID=1940789 RepID=UPI001A9C4C07|nr:SGNH/GDSL hydrolase family protein [Lactococcus petauri]USI66037.1 SGNH/GDSL hydrolase family protein [Lactococcus petauri]
MNKKLKIILELAGFLLASLLVFCLLSLMSTPAGNRLKEEVQDQDKIVNYVALGDSLTEGVGDATGQGGFVPLLAKKVENQTTGKVESQNFGHAGDTSTQIYEKMQDREIQTAIKNADFITLTVGGNDVMKVIRDNAAHLSKLKEKDFEQPARNYQNELKKIFETIRLNNPKAHVYVLGIYNPFYMNFPNITALQTIINNWNIATEETVKEEKNTSFIAINDLLYKGIGGEKGISESQSQINDLLYTADSFHPNNIGYQIMADAVFKEYQVINEK